MDLEKMARDEIRELPVYSPGLDADAVRRRYGVERVIKLASNENPLGPSPLAVEAARAAVDDIALYPDGACTELRLKLAGSLGQDPGRFIFGNGTDEVIDLLFYAFFDPGDAAVMGKPTFSSYFLSGMLMGARIISVPLQQHSHDVEEMIAAVGPGARAVFVGTPHNPTGMICTRRELERMLGALPEDVLLVWDEAYREYVDDPDYPDAVDYLDGHPNLVVLRTFSKIYGLAGLRVGYGVADPRLVEYLERVRPAFNVNRVAQAAAIAAIDDTAHLERSRAVNAEGKVYLCRELERLGLAPVPTQANFILVGYAGRAEGLFGKLLERGIIVRDGGPLGYPGHVRMTVGTPEQNRAVIKALDEIIG